MSSADLHSDAQRLAPTLRSWRRHLHAHPELSGEERQTAAFVAKELRAIGLEPRICADGRGVLAELPAPGGGPWVALRADTDALPIREETGLSYASTQPGVMHACGHDAHTAMLLGAARLLHERRDALTRSVRFLFQPHEERYPGGAPALIAEGALDGVESIFGIHISSTLPIGDLGTRPGPFMAAVNPLRARIIGRGGHAAMPDQTVDPVVAAAHAITALQTVVSRNVPITEPVVVSVTQLQAGSADNVIPNEVSFSGTIRTFQEKWRGAVCRRVEEVIVGVARAHQAEARVEIDPGYPVLCNDARQTDRALQAARAVGFADNHLVELPPIGGGEDFAYYCERVPGVFVFLGAANPAKGCVHPHHHPRFDVDEDALPHGAALHAQFAMLA